MIRVTEGDKVVVRDVLKSREWSMSVMAAVDNVISSHEAILPLLATASLE